MSSIKRKAKPYDERGVEDGTPKIGEGGLAMEGDTNDAGQKHQSKKKKKNQR